MNSMNPATPDCNTAFGPALLPMKVKKPKQTTLVEVSPATITYRAPFGKSDQHQSVFIKSTSSSLVTAYKATTDRHSLYTVLPRQGVLRPQDSVKIEAALLDSAQEKDLPPKDKPHHFIVQAVAWPKNASKFDEDVWNELVDVKQVQVQKVVINIHHEFKRKSGQTPPPSIVTESETAKHSFDTSSYAAGQQAQQAVKQPVFEDFGQKQNVPPNLPQPVPLQTQPNPPQPVPLQTQQSADGKPVYYSPKSKVETEEILVNVQPANLIFQAPYGQKQKQILNLTNPVDDVIGIKVYANKPNFYNVLPVKQLLQPKTTGSVVIELNYKFDQNECNNALPGTHQFRIQAMQWPSGGVQFEDSVWTQLVQQKTHMQIITVGVIFL